MILSSSAKIEGDGTGVVSLALYMDHHVQSAAAARMVAYITTLKPMLDRFLET